MSIGERLRWLLVVRRRTQCEAAALAGLSQSTIGNLVATRSGKPSAHTLLVLARTLNTTPEFILFGEGQPLLDAVSTNDDEATLLSTFRRLNAQSRRTLLVFAGILSDNKEKGLAKPALD